MNIAVVIVSGGMDSVTLAHYYKEKGMDLSILSFDYGQRHAKELGFAKACADRLGAKHTVVDLAGLRSLLPGSSLTDDAVEVPEGHYEAETMKATVVPNRNAIMLAVAYGHAIAIGAKVVAFGAHGGDHFIYPDCRPAFWDSLKLAFQIGNEGFGDPGLTIEAPFMATTKAAIAKMGHEYGVPFEETWSCYKGGDLHCGKCGTCVERREAFALSGIEDPTAYEE
jgi:7-cyano-7-deazaguanine synthase